MKTIIYLTGKQGSGKSILASAFRNAREFNLDNNKIKLPLLRKELAFNECIVIVSKYKKDEFISKFLKRFAKKNDLYYFNLNLKSNEKS